jgi:6-phosphogluconolactonase (cycloisomerase 2 family)
MAKAPSLRFGLTTGIQSRVVRSRDFLSFKLLALIAIATVAAACLVTTPAYSAKYQELLYVENPDGALLSYKIERDGALTLIGTLGTKRQTALPFSAPSVVTIAVQPGGRFAYSTDPFQGGISFAMKCYIVDSGDGRLLPNPDACSPLVTIQGVLTMSPPGRALYLSQYDQAIYPYAIDQATGRVSKVGSKVESGMLDVPVLTASGKFAYVLHRRANNITSYKVAADGSMRLVSGSEGVPTGTKPVAMVVDPGGYFAYVANSGDDTISEYFIDPLTGALKVNPNAPMIRTGKVPSSIVIDASGRFLYCANSADESINHYRVEADGSLQIFGGVTEATGAIGNGVMTTDPAGKFLYVRVGAGRKDLIGFKIANEGQLQRLGSAPIAVIADAPGFTPVASWIGSRPAVQIAKRDVTPLMRMKTSVAGTFTETGRMTPPTYQRSLGGTLLPDGRVFLPEQDGQQNLHAEIYDPRSGTFASSGIVAKRAHVVARLKDGRFLIQFWPLSDLVSVLDPVTMKTIPDGNFKASCHYAYWLLNDGRVLFPSMAPFNESRGCEGEIYDPSTGQSVDTPKALADLQIIAVLADGRLLLLSRSGSYEPPRPTKVYTYDLANDRISLLGEFPLLFAINLPIVLKDGTVLFVNRNEHDYGNTAELFDPINSKFVSLGPLAQTHGDGFSLTLLRDGRVLISGGAERSNAELFDPQTRKFTPTGAMTTVRGGGGVIVVLGDGSVLVAGGDLEAIPFQTGPSSYDTAEIYHPPARE